MEHNSKINDAFIELDEVIAAHIGKMLENGVLRIKDLEYDHNEN